MLWSLHPQERTFSPHQVNEIMGSQARPSCSTYKKFLPLPEIKPQVSSAANHFTD